MENKFLKWIPKKNMWLILLLVGILLVVVAMPTTNSKETSRSIYTPTDQNTTEMEKRLENMLSYMQGVGEVHVMITYQDREQVEGIVIVAKGGGDAVVIRNITEVVQALFDVDSHKIKVIEKSN